MPARTPDRIVKLLRFFAELRNFSVVDRIANALSAEAVEVALFDAIRTARSLAASGRLDDETREALKRVLKISEDVSDDELLRRFREDVIPGDDELDSFLRAIRFDLSRAREVAIKALAG